MTLLATSMARAAAAALAVLSLCNVAAAGLVAPGERVCTQFVGGAERFTLDPSEPSFAGETLATRTDVVNLPGNAEATVTQKVVRESATDRLAFHYHFANTGGTSRGTLYFSSVEIWGFSIRQGNGTDSIERAAVTDMFATTGEGCFGQTGGFPVEFSPATPLPLDVDFVVRTDATTFGMNRAYWEWELPDELFPDTAVLRAFAPTGLQGDDGGPKPVPLPRGAWTGLVTTAGIAATARLLKRSRP